MLVYVLIAAAILAWYESKTVHILPEPLYVRASRFLVEGYADYLALSLLFLERVLNWPSLAPLFRLLDAVDNRVFPSSSSD